MKVLACATAAMLAPHATTVAADMDLTTSVKLTISKKPNDKRVKPPFGEIDLRLWLSEDMAVIRGVLSIRSMRKP